MYIKFTATAAKQGDVTEGNDTSSNSNAAI